MPGLADSRWAPKYNHAITYARSTTKANNGYGPPSSYSSSTTTTTRTTTTTTTNTPQRLATRLPASYNELTRYTKIVRRLKWKLPYLASGYRQAVDRVGPHVDRDRVAEAELMFKIDFFEYYMLIERALVHLLGVFGISVSPSFAARGRSGTDTPHAVNGGGGQQQQYYHRYHVNVLEALDNPENPLHEALGTGEVRRQLWRAKDLRNRWKNADEGGAAANGYGNGNANYKGAAKDAAPLESYDLENILTVIFDGFDRAFVVAEQHVIGEMEREKLGEGPGGDVMDGFEMAASEEAQWEFMVEAMDWEAV